MLDAMVQARHEHAAWEALHLPPTVAKVDGAYVVVAVGDKPFRSPPWDGSRVVEFDWRVGATTPFWGSGARA